MNILELAEITGSSIELSYQGQNRRWLIRTNLMMLIGERVAPITRGIGKTPFRAAEELAKNMRSKTVTIESGDQFTRKFVVPDTLVGFDRSFDGAPSGIQQWES